MTAFVTSNLRFDTSGLVMRKDEPTRRLWLNGLNDVLELRAFAVPPDIPVSLRDAAGLRAYYQRAAQTQGAEILSLETLQIPSAARVRLIRLLMRSAAKPSGFTYVGSIAVPFKRGSFVLRHQAVEIMPRADLSAQADDAHPAHALTRIRGNLERLGDDLRLSDDLRLEPRFEVNPAWMFWRR